MEIGNSSNIVCSLLLASGDSKMVSRRYTGDKVSTIVVRGKSMGSTTSSVSRQSQKSVAQTRAVDKLPSTISCPYNLLELQLDSINPEALSVAIEETVFAEQIRVVLLTTVNKLLDSFPSGWKKVSLLILLIAMLLHFGDRCFDMALL